MLFVAVVGDHPLGFALVDDFGKFAHLEEIDVDPKSMRQGVATTLINSVMEQAKQSGKKYLSLRTFSTTPWSLKLYQKLGFEKVGDSVLPYLKSHIESERKIGLPMSDRISMLMQFVP